MAFWSAAAILMSGVAQSALPPADDGHRLLMHRLEDRGEATSRPSRTSREHGLVSAAAERPTAAAFSTVDRPLVSAAAGDGGGGSGGGSGGGDDGGGGDGANDLPTVGRGV